MRCRVRGRLRVAVTAERDARKRARLRGAQGAAPPPKPAAMPPAKAWRPAAGPHRGRDGDDARGAARRPRRTCPTPMPPPIRSRDDVHRLRPVQRGTRWCLNLRAEEYPASAEEHDTLATEKRSRGRRLPSLRTGIRQPEREGRAQAPACKAFNEVNAISQALHPIFFAGGEARLVLVESDGPDLEAGLEILWPAARQEAQQLSSCRAGTDAERRWRLIFAVFRRHPAPICVLDEVDDALKDDANVNAASATGSTR